MSELERVLPGEQRVNTPDMKDVKEIVEEKHAFRVMEITTEESEMEIDLNDGDEYLLSSSNNTSTKFTFSNELCLVLLSSRVDESIIYAFSNNNIESNVNIELIKGREIYIKRVGHMILVSTIGTEL